MSPLQIRILGVPENGAKSRVETQLKLCIQLLTEQGTKVNTWSHLRLAESMLARSKLRKSQQQKMLDGPTVGSLVSDEASILSLEAKVICASNPERQRKRADRSKEGRPRSGIDIPDIGPEHDRVLLFNCNPMVNFSSGDAILPTRITCYCRHHNEKIGFRVCFAMKDYQGNTVATGASPPIMITDDHKSSKKSRKRSRSEEPVTPAVSRRGSMTDTEPSSSSGVLSTSSSSSSLNMLHMSPLPPTPGEEHSFLSDLVALTAPRDTPDDTSWINRRRRRTTTDGQYTSEPVFYPQLERLVPSQGPTYGGIEVTVLGSGFYQGLTCLFGEHAAATVYWNPNTLVCILPPATNPGPVLVSFKEHPLVLESQDVALFTYYDASDQALLELALQVVGLKMTGKLHDAKQIAMRIVQGGDGQDRSIPSRTTPAHQQGQQQDPMHPVSASALEQQIIQALEDIPDVSHANLNGHTMLHLAVLLNYQHLVEALIRKSALLNAQDRNGLTPLHFACWKQMEGIARLLAGAGADPSIPSILGSPLELGLATLLTSAPSSIVLKRPARRRSSLKLHRFHSLDITKTDTSTPMDQNGLGLVQPKFDQRLYLFWLPLLLCKHIDA
ncbi:SPT3 Dosage dependent suppressor of Ty-induced promoter mutations-like protein [Apophysomyces ossiformis]|uniref:SPT3 Dosage dependent suppressor of Ty-induced promoter mutations-like protein n=1 Tax=Apophysomyces ossiformis TaxID=679940 RepID=A0A8H7BUY4_9FUNG|nr:SPT3 Dosage dependent suppressor of Ty-induced promoter mutations-like protein [Apophysomyces ossiformis]